VTATVESPADTPPPPGLVAAEEADLIYVSDQSPGIRRLRSGDAFRYVDADGRAVRDPGTLSRIRGLAIPPAWKDVWICPTRDGHLQSTGRDARGRKQYRYHPRWREVRDRTKYERTIAFAQALPRIRERVERDLALPGLQRDKVLATIVRLLETTLIRVGNEEYSRTNGSIGLTTMRDRHVEIDGSTMRFEFRGKSGKRHSVAVRDRRLARIVRRCQEVRGYELFQYIDDAGERQTIDSSDVNEYLRSASGDDFTAKDYRTWAGTVLAALALQELGTFASATEAKRNLARAAESVAKQLGNTPAICRKCYIHPDVIDRYLEGGLAESLTERAEEHLTGTEGLDADEAAVLALLRGRLRAEAEESRGRKSNAAAADPKRR
jgi:DNA topoisomerase-1